MQTITYFNGKITISLPYNGKLPAVIWYLDGAGQLKEVDCAYNAKTKTVTFAANFLSKYVIAGLSDEGGAVGSNAEIPFEDVKMSDWFSDGVMYVYKKGIMTGTNADSTRFDPHINISRGMIASILYRLEGSPDISGVTNPFNDTNEGKWYTDAVTWMANNDMTAGVGGGKYAPDTAVTRQDLAVILARYMNFKEIVLPVTMQFIIFADETDIAPYAMNAMQTFNKLGIINGTGKNESGQIIVKPKASATRAETATMLMKKKKKIE
jgi:hypothetical protein